MPATLHLISHTHWDREWYLPYQEFRLRLVRLIDGLLDLLARDPAFRHFMLDGQTIVLEDYLEIRPEREAELRRLVRSGRLLIGPWHVLPDEFLVGPEAAVRNLLAGAQTCRRFGPRMPVGYTPDPFGHIGQLPQILRGFGIVWTAFRRGLADEPCEVWWQAPDGSRVLAAYLRDGYDNAAGLHTGDPALFAEEVVRIRGSLRPHSAVNDLLLMHGTDHMEPPPDTSAAIRLARDKFGGDRLVSSTLPDYFRAVAAQIRRRRIPLPVVAGELRSPKRHHLLPGVLSSRMWIKQENRAAEVLLERWAEPFAAFAARALPPRSLAPIVRDPAGPLRAAWRMLMQNHPHDSICGCSIDEVHEEMRPRFAQAQQIAGEIARASLEALAAATDTRGGARAVAVFNPAAGPRTGPVEAELHPPAEWDAFEIAAPDGTVLPHQAAAGASAELINVVIDRASLAGIIGGLHDGRVGNLSLRGLAFRREGDLLRMDAEMAENDSPDPAVWKSATDSFRRFLADPSIARFHIRARNRPAMRTLFVAPEVPGFGWKTFFLREKRLPGGKTVTLNPIARAAAPPALWLAETAPGKWIRNRLAASSAAGDIENEFFRIRPGPEGTLELVDKRTGARFRGLNRFRDGGDRGDSYNYCAPERDLLVSARRTAVRVRRGAACQTLEIDLELTVPAALRPDRRSRSARRVRMPVATRVSLYPGLARVDVHTTVDNRAEDHRLRVHFPFPDFSAADPPAVRYDGHFEIVRRPPSPPEDESNWAERSRPEVPQRAFTDVSAGTRGLMIANRGLPEVEAAGGCGIALTLLRCTGWLSRDDFPARTGHAGPLLPVPGAQLPGRWEFDYAIIPHGGDWRAASALARAFEAPLRAVETGAHPGRLPAEGSILSVSPAGFEISAVKPAEDGHGIVVRGWNSAAEPVRVRLRPGVVFPRAERTNLAEERLGSIKPGARGEIACDVQPAEIITIRFW